MSTDVNAVEISKRKIPDAKRGRRGKWTEAISRLRPGTGDSFLIPISSVATIYQSARRVGVKVITRRLDDTTAAVWRKT